MTASRLSVSLLVLTLSQAACDRSRPVTPTSVPAVPARPSAAATALSSETLFAVFQTTPRAKDGRIGGPRPLTVRFNLCRSRAESPGDELKFTYDFDGDGVVDELGHCRAQHTFEAPATARVCVANRRPDGAICRTYQVTPEEEATLPEPEHVLRLSLNGCGEVGSRYLYLDTVITPPIPAGQPYSLTITVDGDVGSAPYRETVATVSDFDCDDHSPRLPDSSPLPNEHVATMSSPRCPHARPYVFTAIEGAPPVASRIQTTVHDFQVPGRRTRIVGRTTYTCP